MVGGHCHPQVGGTCGRCGGIGVRSPSSVEGGGGEWSLSSLVVGSWCHSRFSTLGWTVVCYVRNSVVAPLAWIT